VEAGFRSDHAPIKMKVARESQITVRNGATLIAFRKNRCTLLLIAR